jgi:DNA-binding MarR family transcriptional regulator
MVDRLEQRGLVERRMQPTDRRVKAVVLTELGAKTKRQLLERLDHPPEELLALDRADLEALRAALEKLPTARGDAPGCWPSANR